MNIFGETKTFYVWKIIVFFMKRLVPVKRFRRNYAPNFNPTLTWNDGHISTYTNDYSNVATLNLV